MASGIPTRLTAAQGRKFGLTVGGAFLVFGSIAWWRGKTGIAPYLLSLGGLFCAGGLVVPTWLGPVEKAWMGLAHLISKVTTPIFMGLIYFLVITPTGALRRMAGHNAMRAKASGNSFWATRSTAAPAPDDMEHQF